MTFEVTVAKRGGAPIPMALVIANDEATGKSFSRGTDGNGYANVALFDVPVGTPITLSVQAGGYLNAIQYPTTTVANQSITIVLDSFKKPFQPAPRYWNGQMCGLRIPGLPFVPGMEGAPDGLFLSWFYDRYDSDDRATLRAAMQGRGYTHWLLSWPDSRAYGQSPADFLATCRELIDAGFYPCVMLSSKDVDARDVLEIIDQWDLVLGSLIGVVPMFCVGWELSLWLTPIQVQQLTDYLAQRLDEQPDGAQTLRYVHFQQHYFSFQQSPGTAADYWKLQVGKLTGILAQKVIPQGDAAYLDWISDCLVRCAGQFNMPTDSGFGHPFDFVAFELSAMTQFGGTCSEAEGDRIGQLAIDAPAESGPAGTVKVMGSGNGSQLG